MFLVVIFLAFRHYFGQNRRLIEWVRQMKLGRALAQAWAWLRQGWRKAQTAAGKAVQAGAARLRALRRSQGPGFNLMNALSSRLPPRQQVLLAYLLLVRANEQYGIRRRSAQTPYDYAASVTRELPEAAQPVDTLTHHFIEARYTRHPIASDMADEARACLKQVQRLGEEKQRQADSGH